MRVPCVLVAASLLSACATSRIGTWRADGATATATDPVPRVAEPRGVRYADDHDGRLDDGDELLGCLGQAAVIGGAAAVIYLTRFRGRGGGGGDEPATRRVPASVAPAAAGIVEAEPVEDGVFRPCGPICGAAAAP